MNAANSESEQRELPATRRSRDEDWHERAKWTPSAEEFDTYLTREVAMAKLNISRGNPANTTLHSSSTLARAQEELDRETGNKS